MTDLEISAALALAIGWTEDRIDAGKYFDSERCAVCLIKKEYPHEGAWKFFDYRDWNVIGPIAERYDCFPRKSALGYWHIPGTLEVYKTPQEAVAMAVIRMAT